MLGTENIETNKGWFLFWGGQKYFNKNEGDHWGFTEDMAFEQGMRINVFI